MTSRSPTHPIFAGLLAFALAQCGGASDEGSTGASREAIVGGAVADAPGSPVLYLSGPEGSCTAVLVAPNLVITARHCVAHSINGSFSCTPMGDLIPNMTGAGSIGTDDSPGTIGFFSPGSVAAGATISGNPDAVGMQIVSTNTPSACRDDLALVVLDRAMPGLLPAPIRISSVTRVGEMVSVWGYGLTDHFEPTALRVRDGVPITAVGPDTPPMTAQPAPVRCLRVGPVTCNGDSGGPLVSDATGAVIAVVSLGTQSSGPYCVSSNATDTFGPRLGAYQNLILLAFQKAGATPIPEASMTDAGSDAVADATPAPDSPDLSDSATEPESTTASDDAPDLDSPSTPEAAPTAEPPSGPVVYRATGASCAVGLAPPHGARRLGALAIALAWTAVAARRRRR